MINTASLAADLRTVRQMLRGQGNHDSHAQRLQEFYAPQAEHYDAFRKRLLQGRSELIDRLAIAPGSRLVELGCGTGSSLDSLGDRVASLARIDLVDLCPALLAIARRRAQGLANVHISEADASVWSTDREVDMVLLSYALTMIPDWPAVLANARRMLVPGGRIGVVDFHLPLDSGRLSAVFWRRWFGHDGVRLSAEHLSRLKQLFKQHDSAELRASVPYLPVLKAPYYWFIGIRDTD